MRPFDVCEEEDGGRETPGRDWQERQTHSDAIKERKIYDSVEKREAQISITEDAYDWQAEVREVTQIMAENTGRKTHDMQARKYSPGNKRCDGEQSKGLEQEGTDIATPTQTCRRLNT